MVESRGRWRTSKKQVDTYIDFEKPVPDANVSSCLCGPSGPINYKLNKNLDWLTDNFIKINVTPNIAKMTSPEIAVSLGKALLYCCIKKYSEYDETFELIPNQLREKIIQNVLKIGNYDNVNEIWR